MTRRLPIRTRVTFVFVVVMAMVFAALGVFIYLRQDSELERTTDDGLRSRAADISTLVRGAGSELLLSGRGPLADRGESVAQILDRSGRVVDAAPALRARALLTRADIRRAAAGRILLDREAVPESEGTTRLFATAVRVRGRPFVIVVGTSLDDAREAQHSLAALLVLALPIALLLAAAAAFAVVTAALAPIEVMRRRAADIQAADPVDRLPVPVADDEVRRLGLTLNSMLDRLEAALAHERQFVSDASHELRTPLAILKAELEVALMSHEYAPALRAAISSAVEESDRLNQLAEDLLVVARSDQGGLAVRRESFAADELLESTRTRFQSRADAHGVALEVRSPGGLTVAADRLRIEQALTNMVENALRHGGGAIELTAAVARSGAAVEFCVRDHGAGFADELAERAFERFSRGDASRGGGGAGLGLAIVDAIARAHGGTAYAETDPTGGARVTLVIPTS